MESKSTHKRPRKSITEKPKEKKNKTATEPESLTRLCSYPNTHGDKTCGSKLQQGYASLAESVRRTLISNLTSDESDENIIDIGSIIDLSNTAFASLNLFQADYRDLYDVVKEFILNQCKHLEAEKDHAHYERWIRPILSKRSPDYAKAEFEKAKASATKAEAEVASLKAQVQETRASLKGLEEKLEKGNKEVEFLRSESDRLEKTYVDSEAKFRDLEKNLLNIELRFGEKSDHAKGEIRRSKAKFRAVRSCEPML